MPDHAIAPWRYDNPAPLWMRLTDARNQPNSGGHNRRKKYQYICIEPDGHIEMFERFLDCCQHYGVTTGTLSIGLRNGKLTLDRKVYRFVKNRSAA